MQSTRFLIGELPDGSERWVSIDELARHLEGRVCERRFPAYCAPFTSEAEARFALKAAGALNIEAEERPRGRARRGAR